MMNKNWCWGYMAKYIRVLAVVGGGVRGLIPLRFSLEIENRTKKTISELFDVVAGTSIGAITSLLLGVPQNPGALKPKYGSADLIQLFLKKSSDIFYSSVLREAKTLNGLVGASYDRTALDGILSDYFQDVKLSEVLVPTFISFYSLSTRMPIIVDSYVAKNEGASEDFYCKDVAAASSAAPTYFSPYKFSNLSNTKEFMGVDGGLFVNNPTLVGLAGVYHMRDSELLKSAYYGDSSVNSANKLLKADNIFNVSLGTGTFEPVSDHEIINDGAGGWIAHGELLDDMFNASAIAAAKISELLLPENQSFTLQPVLPLDNQRLDDASSDNLQELISIAENYIKTHDKEFDTIAKLLTQ
jgi:uncharacterized protein